VRRRALGERLRGLLARLEGPDAGSRLEPGAPPEALLAALDRAADELDRRLDEAADATARVGLALDAVPQGIVVRDPTGAEVLRNRAALAFVDARHAEALVEQALEELLAEAVDGVPRRRELDVLGPPPRMLVLTALPLEDAAGRVLGTLGIVDDVSERRRLDAVRRDFVANISHELKTPVGALGLLAETIAAEDDPAVVQRLADRMNGEALRVGRIVDDLLALSRIEADEQPVREPVAVAEVVGDAVERVRSLADATRTTIDTSGVGARHVLLGDFRQLVSAVANLLENACKYGDEGSSVQVASKDDGSWVEIAVRDHGIGIPARDLERVFERFYRVDRARSRVTGGTGLGLAIVRHVAENHGGQVSVRSSEGDGSTFTLRLPASRSEAAAPDVPTAPRRVTA
jgi:two-component system sensor histidine kinase SenX3